MNICFWCNRVKDSNEQDERPIYRDYEFCPSCACACERGITLVQVTSEENDNPEIREGLRPTGKWVVVSEEDATKVLTGLPILDTVLRVRQMFINEGDWEKLNLP